MGYAKLMSEVFQAHDNTFLSVKFNNIVSVTESMAGFLAAEQLADQSVSESRIHQAIDEAQARQQVYNSSRPQPKGTLCSKLIVWLKEQWLSGNALDCSIGGPGFKSRSNRGKVLGLAITAPTQIETKCWFIQTMVKRFHVY